MKGIFLSFQYPAHEAPHAFYRYSVYRLIYKLEKNGMEIVSVTPEG